ncbi:hypothetical protein AVEN_85996-1 [Araneus ventricosus]|uniref:Uncharacterized protein n=1 Tax=Araneus ventricosus TaxID=182803 RepID=A0A4Y2DYN4_ARAVE|nr:hypothetical protein AVEN_197186-1 [Araneus ventricosus]GBM21271.1 hypothetical protein AVEN_44703-1 [Araneus ventricosus]GBM21325.1 hypothetical protein AVEN_87372-1 [Araneus ventricosus]GBM21993.1 hypothetical protein AVEN_85996-1 [Araneus ventricosus]
MSKISAAGERSQAQDPACARPHLRNAASPGIFSCAGIDGSRWEKDRDCRWDGQKPAAAVVCTAPHEGSVVVE